MINIFFFNQNISQYPQPIIKRKLHSIDYSCVLEKLQKFPVTIKMFPESESPSEWGVEEALKCDVIMTSIGFTHWGWSGLSSSVLVCSPHSRLRHLEHLNGPDNSNVLLRMIDRNISELHF